MSINKANTLVFQNLVMSINTAKPCVGWETPIAVALSDGTLMGVIALELHQYNGERVYVARLGAGVVTHDQPEIEEELF